MRKYLNPEIRCIFVILGKGCNMKCKYCLQAPYDRQEVTQKNLPRVVDFINDIAQNQNSPLTVQFFGGEPLLYVADMKRIVKMVEHNKNVNLSVITNGTLITSELADYLNAHNFNVAVSWDGRNTTGIRGLDVFERNKENILKINRLGISAIISSYCYPQDFLDDVAALRTEYKAATGNKLGYCMEEFLDTGIDNCQPLLANQEKLVEQMHTLCEHYWRQINQQEHNEHYAYFIEGQVQYLRRVLDRGYLIGAFTRCGDGTTVVNLDLQGNLYKCHNHEVKIGTIDSPFWEVLQLAILTDNSVKHREECEECYVAPFCQGGCALIEDFARKHTCELHLAFYGPLMDLVLRIQKTLGQQEVPNEPV